ncbi:MAG: flavin-containing monooxygenase [Burkholderiaceae bacterium]
MSSTNHSKSTEHEFDAIVIGAGFSGLYQVLSLREKLGLDVIGFEAGEAVGGTWHWNRYPGARCDSESHSYCYAFSDELIQEWEWSERYPGAAEIRRYLDFVADRFDLKRSFQFNTRITAAQYDESANQWEVTTEHGDCFRAQFLITAVGCLSTANVPAIDGLDEFAGNWYHTGQWPHEGVDFSGKRVGQIGTGSTGIQSAPVIAETAKHLTVFQRTANYSIPARNAPLTKDFKEKIKANFGEIRETMHKSSNGHPFLISRQLAVETDEAQRKALYEEAWEKGGLQFRATFWDLLTDQTANDTAADFIKQKIREIVKDEQTAAVLADIDHPYATKRPPIDTNYFETYNRPNVSLVDLRQSPIERITPAGIKTSSEEYPLDIIVFATGFDAMTGPLLRLNISGKQGVSLKQAWSAGPKNYLGLQVAGFPNLFTITGPGSPSVLCNMPVAIEQHVDWITECIRHLKDTGITRIEATDDACENWVKQVNDVAHATLMPKATHSWYQGANVPGKPRVFMPFAGGMARYRRVCDEVAANHYSGFELAR